jgi:regulator of PEP synthase PpsR (kinase-PPPase family)
MASPPIARTVYIVSDSTGITAETFSQSVLSQFEGVTFRPVRLPYVDTFAKADEVVARINRNAAEAGVPPIVFSTLVTPEILARGRESHGIFS